jgi:sugar phosphate isomerase/epimerase
MNFAICNEGFESRPWPDVCDFVASLGYHGIEIAPFIFADSADQITPDQRRDIRRTAEQRNLQLIGLHWLLVKPPGLHITRPDPATRKRTADYFLTLTQLCADLGGHVLVIGSPHQRSLQPGVSPDQALNNAIEVFRPSLDLAAKTNVTLAIEPLRPAQTDFITTAAQGLDLVRRINHPNFQLHLDVIAMSSEPKPIPDVIREGAPHLAHFHVNDPNMQGPGMGDLQYEPIIAALREVHYLAPNTPGWLSVEAFDFKPGIDKIARESVNYLRRVTGA